MKKKEYLSPSTSVVMIKQQCCLLKSSNKDLPVYDDDDFDLDDFTPKSRRNSIWDDPDE